MNRKRCATLFIFFALIFAGTAVTAQDETDSYTVERWEYAGLVYSTDPKFMLFVGGDVDAAVEINRMFMDSPEDTSVVVMLNRIGQDGWELMSVLADSNLMLTQFFFKRPVRQPVLTVLAQNDNRKIVHSILTVSSSEVAPRPRY